MLSTFIDKQTEQYRQYLDRYLRIQYGILEEIPIEIYKQVRKMDDRALLRRSCMEIATSLNEIKAFGIKIGNLPIFI